MDIKNLTLTFVIFVTGCVTSTDPIVMRVIDKETNDPIEGAIAIFDLSASFAHGNDIHQLGLTEVLSDETGRIHFPSYEVPSRYLSQKYALDNPLLIVLKKGYYPVFINNEDHLRHDYTEIIWNYDNTDIHLEKANNNNKYAELIYRVSDDLNSYYSYPSKDRCAWKLVPLAIMAGMHEEVSLFSQYNIKSRRGVGGAYYSLWGNEKTYVKNGCGNPVEFFSNFPTLCPDNLTHMKNIKRKMKKVSTSTYYYTTGYCENDAKTWTFTPRNGWLDSNETNLGHTK